MAGDSSKMVHAEDGGGVARAAVDAHLRSKEGGVPAGEDITSLNKLLQWGAAHSDKASMAGTAPAGAADRQWLDAIFPDMNAAVKAVIGALSAELAKGAEGSAEDVATHLEDLEEYMADLNYAQNIGPLGAVAPLMEALEHEDGAVRAAALWAVGSALQDMPANCARLVEAGVVAPMVRGLTDAAASVRLKAIRCASAFLRAAAPAERRALREAGAERALAALLGDADARVRSRACFFAAHAATTGNGWLLDAVLGSAGGGGGEDDDAVTAAVRKCDASDVQAVEAVLGAVSALTEHSRAALLERVPTLHDDVVALQQRCTSDEMEAVARRCAERLR